jgi:hypothetical protein
VHGHSQLVALHEACVRNNVPVIEFLLEKRAKPNEQDKYVDGAYLINTHECLTIVCQLLTLLLLLLLFGCYSVVIRLLFGCCSVVVAVAVVVVVAAAGYDMVVLFQTWRNGASLCRS